MKYTIELSDKAVPVIQLAFDTENARRTASVGPLLPYATLDDFLTDQIVIEFGVSEEQLAAADKAKAIDALQVSLPKLDIADITDLAIIAADKVRDKGGGPVTPEPGPVEEVKP